MTMQPWLENRGQSRDAVSVVIPVTEVIRSSHPSSERTIFNLIDSQQLPAIIIIIIIIIMSHLTSFGDPLHVDALLSRVA